MNKKVNNTSEDVKNGDFAFSKKNYIFLATGVGVLIIGFILMIGGASDNPNVFNPEVFSVRRITIAPIVVLLGFATVLYAILKKSN